MNRLRELRKERKLTLVELAEILHMNRTSISRYELGEVEMKADTIQIFSEFFRVSADYLLGKSDVRKPREMTDSELQGIKLALYEQIDELTDDQLKDVLKFIGYIKS